MKDKNKKVDKINLDDLPLDFGSPSTKSNEKKKTKKPFSLKTPLKESSIRH